MGYNSSESYFYHDVKVLNDKLLASVIVPLSAVGILINMFFFFCMVFPPQGAEKLKTLLKVLLGSLIACNTIIQLCCLLILFSEFVLQKLKIGWESLILMTNLLFNIMMYTMVTSVTSCHWKNMFYFCQIVPLRNSFFIWIKRNMQSVIYSALVFNAIFSIFGITIDTVYTIKGISYCEQSNLSSEDMDLLWNSLQLQQGIKLANLWARLVFFWLSLSVTLTSSIATALYLWKHMKNLEASGLSSPHLQRQIKVIITGIIAQALVHVLCSGGIFIDEIMAIYSSLNFSLNDFILYTIISFYSFGSTINMGVSQSLFRQGAVLVWEKLCLTLRFQYINK